MNGRDKVAMVVMGALTRGSQTASQVAEWGDQFYPGMHEAQANMKLLDLAELQHVHGSSDTPVFMQGRHRFILTPHVGVPMFLKLYKQWCELPDNQKNEAWAAPLQKAQEDAIFIQIMPATATQPFEG